METERRNEKRAAMNPAERLFCVISVCFIGYFALKYLAAILLPFIISFLGGALIYKLSDLTHRKTKLPRRLLAVAYIAVFILAAALSVIFISGKIFAETEKLFITLGEDGGGIGEKIENIFGFFEDIGSKIPFIERIENIEGLENVRESIGEGISRFIAGIARDLKSDLTVTAAKLVRGAPSFVLLIFVTVLSLFYFSMDYGNIKAGIFRLLPKKIAPYAVKYKNIAKSSAKKYLAAYLVLFVITFLIVFAGLVILGENYPFLIALLIAALDFLPLIGAGAILLPWSLLAIAGGDVRFALGLLIIYGVVTIAHQILEPQLLGGSLGIHPLATLFAMYAGLKLFGFAGMFIGPAAALVVKEILTATRGAKPPQEKQKRT